MKAHIGRGSVFCLSVLLGALSAAGLRAAAEEPGSINLREAFANPPMDCRPQTRWWWHGNALTKDDISRQLREMKAQGLGGAEQITMDEVYEKGNVPYLSPEYFELVKHAVAEAKSLGLTLSLNFGGPGWIWGGDWVPEQYRTRALLASMLTVEGSTRFDGPLSLKAAINPRDLPRSFSEILPEDQLVAVVAGRVTNGALLPDSFQILTDRVKDRQLAWEVPEGDWRIMAFWSTIPEGSNAVNHLDMEAMKFYVDTLGQRFVDALGSELGATVESLFGDSFEVPIHRNGIYWADSLPDQFKARKGYDLIPLLPAIWWDMGKSTGGARYAVNKMLHHQGMVAFYNTFNEWCDAHGVKSRIQPYGFVTDNLEGAGQSDIPEMEITAGEKDAVPWFDTRIGPREYVASGAHIYGRNIISVEAYTYLHWEPYRATLEELKITSDTFLRAGANRFNNHGFIASPEQVIAPTRGFYAAIHISPDNVWWPYYRHLSDYIARSCYLLRQGRPVADIAIYAPTASQWTKDALNARSWTRSFDWGELGRLLLSSGYQFDLVNDEVLQRKAKFDGPALRIQDNDYRVLILPNIEAMPVASLQRVADYAKQGGTVIALEQRPSESCDLNWPKTASPFEELVGQRVAPPAVSSETMELKMLVSELFPDTTGKKGNLPDTYGAGTTYWLEKVMDRSNILDKRSAMLDPFLRALNHHVAPDMAIDFVREDMRENNGLTFTHRRMDGRDLYFVTNIQDRPIDMPVGFRVTGAAPSCWDPISGTVTPLHVWEERDGATWLPLRLAPYASTFVVFEAGDMRPHLASTSLRIVERVDERGVTGWSDRAGIHTATLPDGTVIRGDSGAVPAPFAITTPWSLTLDGRASPRIDQTLDALVSWTDTPETKYFSGTGIYATTFQLPEGYEGERTRLELDLGDVGNVAEVRINGKVVGVIWMRGQTLNITPVTVEGRNEIFIRVTNTLINRVSGLKEFPPVPEELRERLGGGLQDDNSPAHALRGYTPLPRSGLLGPVEIRAYKRVALVP